MTEELGIDRTGQADCVPPVWNMVLDEEGVVRDVGEASGGKASS